MCGPATIDRDERHRMAVLSFGSMLRRAVAVFAIVAGVDAFAAGGVTVDRKEREIRFSATVQPGAMARPFGVRGHHAIVWKDGRSSFWALFAADASDAEVRRGLEAIGARPGENLTPDSWHRREDRTSREPDKRVEGTPVDVFVEWRGSRKRIPLRDLVSEKGRPLPDLDFRYGGNAKYQAEFRSGCIVCLYSCPGGAIGNHSHPIRDYENDGVIYSSRTERLPKAGTRVTIILKLRTEGS
jgi:hypothetical protein